MKGLEIEVELKEFKSLKFLEVLLRQNYKSIYTNQVIKIDGVEKIRIGNLVPLNYDDDEIHDNTIYESELVELDECEFIFYPFIISTQESYLPTKIYEGLWEKLYYDTNIKQQLLNYVETSLLFSRKGVDSNIISINRVVLLYRPPGTNY